MTVVYRNENSFVGPISTLKKLDNGELVIVFREALWRGSSTHSDPSTRTSLLRSKDEGDSWHSKVTPDEHGAQGVSVNQLADGSLIINNFHFSFTKKPGSVHDDWVRKLSGIHITRSTDLGYTWTPERKIPTPISSPTTAGRIIELEDGTLLLPMEGSNHESEPIGTWVLGSEDSGDNWTVRSVVALGNDPDLPGRKYIGMSDSDILAKDDAFGSTWRGSDVGFHETRLLKMSSGRILIGMRTRGDNFFTAYSDDEARSWSKPERTPIFCNGSSPFDLLLLDDKRILATYGHRRPPWGIRACISNDEGKTWETGNEFVLRDDGLDRDMGYPSSQQLDDGRIFTVYYWHNEDQIRHLLSLKWEIG